MLAVDIMLYEENEQLVARSQHGPAFYAFLQTAWAGESHKEGLLFLKKKKQKDFYLFEIHTTSAVKT